MSRAFAGVFGLGVLERQAGKTILKYAGVSGTRLNNLCNSSVPHMFDMLKKGMAKLQKGILEVRKTLADPNIGPVDIMVAEDNLAMYQERLTACRKLYAEIKHDVSKYNLPNNTPICLFDKAFVKVHEAWHAQMSHALPRVLASGQPLPIRTLVGRHALIKEATEKFMEQLGPDSVRFFRMIEDHMSLDVSEELLAGVAGIVNVIARAKHTSTPQSDDRRNVTSAFMTYVEPYGLRTGKPLPNNVDAWLYRSAVEWHSKFGSNMGKAATAFAKVVNDMFARHRQQQQQQHAAP